MTCPVALHRRGRGLHSNLRATSGDQLAHRAAHAPWQFESLFDTSAGQLQALRSVAQIQARGAPFELRPRNPTWPPLSEERISE